MELTEPIESINNQLVDLYGIDTITGLPIWRVVWSEDQFEKRLGTYDDYSPAGIYLRTVTEVRNVPKYRQWIREKYVLENLVLIPEESKQDLPATKMSYEPMFPFQDNNGDYLPPTLIACKWVINCVYAAKGKGKITKYYNGDENLTPEELIMQRDDEISKLESELFGNESYIGDKLAHREAIIVPPNKVN